MPLRGSPVLQACMPKLIYTANPAQYSVIVGVFQEFIIRHGNVPLAQARYGQSGPLPRWQLLTVSMTLPSYHAGKISVAPGPPRIQSGAGRGSFSGPSPVELTRTACPTSASGSGERPSKAPRGSSARRGKPGGSIRIPWYRSRTPRPTAGLPAPSGRLPRVTRYRQRRGLILPLLLPCLQGAGRARSFGTAQPGHAGMQHQQPPSKCLRDPASSIGSARNLIGSRLPHRIQRCYFLRSIAEPSVVAAAGRARSA